jgi:hypothetical protein
MSVVISMRERRAAVRAPLCVDGWVSELGDEGAYPGDEELLAPLGGHIVNLSITGLLIEIDEAICPGREVRVTAYVDGDPVELHGYVVRVAKRPRQRGEPFAVDPDRVVLAIELFDLDAATRALVERLVKAHRPHPVLN